MVKSGINCSLLILPYMWWQVWEGVFFYPGGNIDTLYSWGLGAASNNIVEAYALFRG
jgi:hypothetical protein